MQGGIILCDPPGWMPIGWCWKALIMDDEFTKGRPNLTLLTLDLMVLKFNSVFMHFLFWLNEQWIEILGQSEWG